MSAKEPSSVAHLHMNGAHLTSQSMRGLRPSHVLVPETKGRQLVKTTGLVTRLQLPEQLQPWHWTPSIANKRPRYRPIPGPVGAPEGETERR